MKQNLFLLAFILLLAGCGSKNAITNADDYGMYLNSGIVKAKEDVLKAQIAFWESRLKKDTGNFVDMMKLATCRLKLFKMRGNIKDMNCSDSLLKRISAKLKDLDPDILFALSQNTITQHRFRDAAMFVELAERAGGDPYTRTLLEFDAKLELGEMMMAERNLSFIREKHSFDYLVRLSKLEDQKGNLNEAIRLMELAFEKIKDDNSELYCWALATLGDMYGHAGRVQDAYQAYLKVLQKDDSYIHALKGIAWIAYSHDHNSTAAKRIYQFILSGNNMPDLWLTMAEIAEWEGDMAAKSRYIRHFMEEAEQPAYGNMYNKYLIELYTEELKNYGRALALAEKEIQERATPGTYDWLAWVYFKKGDIDEAREIAINYVYNRNFEPASLLHTALIFSATGEKKKARKLLSDCEASSFELGPVKAKKVGEMVQGFSSEPN